MGCHSRCPHQINPLESLLVSARFEKRKVFSFLRKTLSWQEGFFFSIDRIQFPLTNFFYAYKTWESEKNGFRKNEFLETNKA
jgi:hypothetical protein